MLEVREHARNMSTKLRVGGRAELILFGGGGRIFSEMLVRLGFKIGGLLTVQALKVQVVCKNVLHSLKVISIVFVDCNSGRCCKQNG